MNKLVLRILLIVGILFLLLFGGFKFMQYQTKKASPEATATATFGSANATVNYCQPSVNGRQIFGDLVPFDKVWRTGANEATTFSTTGDLSIGGQTLPEGEYTLWTIPGESEWEVIWNSKQYSWGLGFDGESPRDPEADALTIRVPVGSTAASVEMFSISFNQAAMVLEWADTRIEVPISAS